MIDLVIIGSLFAGAKAYDLKKNNALPRPSRDAFSLDQAKAAFQTFKEEKIKPLFAKDGNRVQVLTDPSEEPEIDEKEEMVKHNLAISSLSLGMATTGVLFSTPLLMLGAVPAAIATIPIYRSAYQALSKEGQIGVAALDSATFTIAMITGQYLAVGLAPFCYYYSQKVLLQRESKAAKELTEVLASMNTFTKGEVITVNAGETILVDGSITSGYAYVDEQYLTGNIEPTEKNVGEPVFASTVVLTGSISLIVENTASETIVAQVSQILTRTADSRKSLRVAGENVANALTLPTAMLGVLAYPFLDLVSMGNIFNADLAYQMSALAPIGLLNHLKVA